MTVAAFSRTDAPLLRRPWRVAGGKPVRNAPTSTPELGLDRVAVFASLLECTTGHPDRAVSAHGTRKRITAELVSHPLPSLEPTDVRPDAGTD